jgi:hypothetical protein
VLSFAGDCTFGMVNGDDGAGRFPAVYRRSGWKDFALVRPWFVDDDLTAVNFEWTLTNVSARKSSLGQSRRPDAGAHAGLKFGLKRIAYLRLH